ncbi:MAG: ABC transporter ATP-binding protein [Ruminococcus sp.]|nr:ABC transporter ATP-binding protein [Ruminococcus sp.]
MNALEIRNISKNYDRFQLENISLELPQGCIMGLIGENGAGKSTLIKAILDLIQKDSGDVLFYGKQLDGSQTELKEEIGVVFDTIHFHEMLTPLQIGSISALTYQNWNENLYQNYLKEFKLPEKSKIKDFSKGMKMKLSIAVALSHRAKLLILDEPTAGLDPIARDELLDIFLDFIQDETHSILISSHITSDLEKIADYITFIHEGKLLFTKSKDELLYDYRIAKCGEADFQKLKSENGAVWRKMDYQYEVLLPEGKAIEHNYPDCQFDNAKIDDIMLLYVKGEKV